MVAPFLALTCVWVDATDSTRLEVFLVFFSYLGPEKGDGSLGGNLALRTLNVELEHATCSH